MRSLNLLILFGIGRKILNNRKIRSASLSYKKGDGQGVVITEGSKLSTAYKSYPTSFSPVQFHIQMTLLQIICVDTDIRGQLLIIYCAFIKYWRKNENGVSNKCL